MGYRSPPSAIESTDGRPHVGGRTAPLQDTRSSGRTVIVPVDTPSSAPETPAPDDASGIFVLGMHRTGTSAITRLLLELGAHLPGTAMPANAANPEGYWEPAQVVGIHDRFLDHLDRDWRSVEAMPADAFNGEAAADARQEIRGLLAEAPDLWSGRWVVKDPRLCRLLPLWREPLNQGTQRRPAYLHVLRSPLAAAASLYDRDGIGLSEGLFLWLRHNLEAEQATRGRDRQWLFFEHLSAAQGPATSGESWLSSVRDRLGRVLGAALSDDDLQEALAKVLKKNLVHHRFDGTETLKELERFPQAHLAFRGFLALDQGRLEDGVELLDAASDALAQADDRWQQLEDDESLSLHLGSPRTAVNLTERRFWDSQIKKSWNDIAALEQELEKARRGMEKTVAQNHDLQAQVETARQRIEAALKDVESHAGERDQACLDASNLRQEVSDLVRRLKEHKAELASAREHQQHLERQLAERKKNDQPARLRAERDQARLNEKNLRSELDDARRQLDDHRQELRRAEEHQRDVRQQLEEAKRFTDVAVAAASQELLRLRASRSYRMLEPLRRIYGRLRGPTS